MFSSSDVLVDWNYCRKKSWAYFLLGNVSSHLAQNTILRITQKALLYSLEDHCIPSISAWRFSYTDIHQCQELIRRVERTGAMNPGSLSWESEASVTASLRHCVTAPLRHCVTAPLRHCATAPLRHCVTASLRHCATAPLRHCATAPLRHCANAPLRHCATAPLR